MTTSALSFEKSSIIPRQSCFFPLRTVISPTCPYFAFRDKMSSSTTAGFLCEIFRSSRCQIMLHWLPLMFLLVTHQSYGLTSKPHSSRLAESVFQNRSGPINSDIHTAIYVCLKTSLVNVFLVCLWFIIFQQLGHSSIKDNVNVVPIFWHLGL